MNRDNSLILVVVVFIFFIFLFFLIPVTENPKQENMLSITNKDFCPKFGIQPGESRLSPFLTKNKFISYNQVFDKLVNVVITNISPTAIMAVYQSDTGERFFMFSLNPAQTDSKEVPIGTVQICLYPNDQQILMENKVSTDVNLVYGGSGLN
jgi:hypothetical protein